MGSVSERLAEIAQRVGETVAGPNAYDVDLRARFPVEAVEALKQEGVLSALVPVELGGMGATLTDLSDMIRVISRFCASTGGVLAMHTSDMFVLLRHGTTPALRRLVKDIVENQLLIANATSEIGSAALEPDGEGWRFDKQVPASSYGLHAELITSSIRRSPEAPASDQVLALFRTADFSLDPTSDWDTLGMRGTCSQGLHIHGHVSADDLYPVPYAEIANEGGQCIHVLLTAVWTGLAEAALAEAHTRVRAVARRQIGTVPQVAMRLGELLTDVQAARSTLADALVQFEAAAETDTLTDTRLLLSLRNVKLITTNAAVRVSTGALQICGISDYRRGREHCLERIIRDAHGGLVMISNDRLLTDNAQLLSLRKSI